MSPIPVFMLRRYLGQFPFTLEELLLLSINIERAKKRAKE
jgi:hypothetical protein